MCLDGKGNETIARELQENKVLIPMAYWRSKGLNRGGKKTQTNPYKWCKTTIQKILSQQEYCGDIINFKTYSKSFKNKRRIENSKENWAVFKDVNEPIIDRETFETVQKFISKTKRRAPKKENGERSIFNGLVYCGDCHGKMRYHTSTSNKEIHYFTCSDNKVDYRGKCPGRHYVRADALEEVVKLELRRLVEMLEIDESYFAQLLLRKNDEEREKDKKFLETELQKAIARSNTVSQLYEKLYEDNVIGKVSDEWFVELSHKYEKERMDLKAKIADIRHKIEELKNNNSEYEKFISAIRRFMQMDNLTSPLLRELIDHIDIFDTEGITEAHKSKSSVHGMEQTIEIADRDFKGLCFVNLVDFDALWGHRRNPKGYAEELEKFDLNLGVLLGKLREDDLLIITADHGNDPTYTGTDHTRERVPFLAYSPSMKESG